MCKGNGHKWTWVVNHLNEVDHVVDHLEEWSGIGFLQILIHCYLNDLATTHLCVRMYVCMYVCLNVYRKLCALFWKYTVSVSTYIHYISPVCTYIHTYIHTYIFWIVNTLSSNAFNNAMAWNRTCLSIPSASKFRQRFTTPFSFRDARKVSTESSLYVCMYVCMYVCIT